MGIILLVVACSSLGACLAGVRAGIVRRGMLVEALGRLMVCLGLGRGFFALNLGLGLLGILAFRGLVGRFLSAYLLDDVSLAILSAAQGVLACLLWNPGGGDGRRERGANAGQANPLSGDPPPGPPGRHAA
jgi:hypothetical protein